MASRTRSVTSPIFRSTKVLSFASHPNSSTVTPLGRSFIRGLIILKSSPRNSCRTVQKLSKKTSSLESIMTLSISIKVSATKNSLTSMSSCPLELMGSSPWRIGSFHISQKLNSPQNTPCKTKFSPVNLIISTILINYNTLLMYANYISG